jgi:ABC-2 type transport system permease protein
VVATLLRIRFRVLGNTLASSPWQLVGFVIGTLAALGMLFLVWAGLFAVGFAGLDATRLAVTIAGGVLLLGWTLGPLFVAGVDTTLDPAKLAPFPITTGQMMRALTLAGLTGVPGLATVIGSLGIFLAYFRWPAAAAAAVVCVPVGLLTCVLASRLVAALTSGAGGNRRVRELIGGAAFLVLVLAGPIMFGILNLVEAGVSAGPDPLGRATDLVAGISWTPLAAVWAVPGDLAAGALQPAVGKFLIALATLAVLWLLWRQNLLAGLASPRRASAATVKQGSLGWVGRTPTGPTGATWGRAQTYWLHDPRYLRQLLVVPLFPVFLLVYSGGDVTNPLFAFSGVLVAFVLGIVPYVDVSYDGTAFATVLATGIRGREDRAGRTLAASVVGLPLIVAVTLLTIGLSGRWDLLPPVLGAAIGMLLTAYGVCAVTSAYLVVPVPGPGDSPFKRVPGSSTLTGLAVIVIWLVIGVLGLPSLVPAVIAAATGQALFGWIALVVGLVLGSGILVLGIFVGGRAFDRNAPALLARLRAFKNV